MKIWNPVCVLAMPEILTLMAGILLVLQGGCSGKAIPSDSQFAGNQPPDEKGSSPAKNPTQADVTPYETPLIDLPVDDPADAQMNGYDLAFDRKYASAARWFTNRLQQDGLQPEEKFITYLDLADMYQMLGDCPNRVKVLSEAAKTYPQKPGILVLRALTHINQGKLDEAEKDVAAAEKLDKAMPSVVFGRFRLDLAQGKGDPVDDLLKMVKADPNNPDYLYYFNRLTWEKKMAEAEMAINANPKDPAGYLARSGATLHLDHFGRQLERTWWRQWWVEQALADADKAVQLDRTKSLAFNNRGEAYQRLGLSTKAKQDFTNAIKADPQDPASYLNRGSLLYNEGQIQASLKDANMVIEVDPKNAKGYSNKGSCLMALKPPDFRGAVQSLTEAIKLDASFEDFFYMRGNSYRNLGDNINALKDYGMAIEKNPGFIPAYGMRGNLRLDRAIKNFSNVAQKKADLDAAAEDYKKVLELNRGDPIATKNLGIVEQHRSGLR